ncbi:hypothetical protein SAMN04488057_101253 [Cyclobacterium lianum]|uniref:SGNH/GDSL hydrolase family protein n=1 Tax=Cyclobacterium lianum TaxID=388280 RepID=A0A1M7IA57_9BACT|nr:SGNH/GDSL hydrolase family protein [Cyclobacterium lianum]SHM37463.1 hypothetical protein SAMN04488057_101253 [Cyclobacterium lianum]
MKISAWLALILLLSACGPEERDTVQIRKILVIGNSITYHPPEAAIGWNGNWGMAATAPDKDYFSLLQDSLGVHLPELEMIRENVFPFERQFTTLDFNQYDYLKAFQPDLLIIRLGENVPLENIDGWNFSQSLRDFAAYLGTAQTRVLLTTTFWPNPLVNEQLLHAATASRWEVVDLSPLGTESVYMALGEYSNESVARHPNNLGMQAISRQIARQLLREP